MFRVLALIVSFGLTMVLLGTMVWVVGYMNTHHVAQSFAVQLHRSSFHNIITPFGEKMLEPFNVLSSLVAASSYGMINISTFTAGCPYDPKIVGLCGFSQANDLGSVIFTTVTGRTTGCYLASNTNQWRIVWPTSRTLNNSNTDCSFFPNGTTDRSSCYRREPYDVTSPSSGIAWTRGIDLMPSEQAMVGPTPIVVKGNYSNFKIQYLVPVFSTDGRTRLGFWKADRYIKWVQTLVAQLSSIAPETKAYVVNTADRLLLAASVPPPDGLDSSTADETRWPYLANAVRIAQKSLSADSVRVQWGTGHQLLTFTRWSFQGVNLLLIAVTPESQLLQSFQQRSNGIIAASVGLTFTICVGTGLVLWVTLAKPLRQLAATFDSFPGPGFDLTLPEDREQPGKHFCQCVKHFTAREVLVLQRSFVAMVGHLRAHVADLQHMTQRATVAGEERMQFLSIMSHEIRTPLNAILCSVTHLVTSTEQQGETNRFTPEQRESIALMQASSEHLLTLLNNVLDLTKIASSQLTLEPGEFQITDEVSMAVQTVAPLFSGKSVELVAFVSPRVPELLCGDSLRVRQILVNLLTNGCKFTAKGFVALDVDVAPAPNEVQVAPGSVHNYGSKHTVGSLECNVPDGRVRLRFLVRDTGVGIASSKLSLVFHRFKQCHDGGLARQFGGAGLGLAIAAELSQLMGGGIAVESEEGEGALFTVVLPFGRVDQDSPVRTTTPREQLSRIGQSKEFDPLISIQDESRLKNKARAPLQDNGFPEVVILPNEADCPESTQGCGATLRYIEKYFQSVSVRTTRLPRMPPGLRSSHEYCATLIDKFGHRKESGLVFIPVALLPQSGWERLASFGFNLVAVLAAKDQTPKGCRTLAIPFTPNSLAATLSSSQLPLHRAPEDELPFASKHYADAPLRVLIVDDNAVNLLLLDRILTSLGCQCTRALSGKEAVALFFLALDGGPDAAISSPFDVVFMDVQMPEMDGLEATQLIRKGEAERGISDEKHTPIVACTAHAFAHDRQQCIVSGMDGYVTKPYGVPTLKAALVAAAQSARRQSVRPP